MQTENNTEGQQPNSGDGANTGDAANPTGDQGKAPDSPEGQGETGKTAPASDVKTEGGDPPKSDALEGAPESYETFTLPEGFTLEGERAKQATEFFKANNFNQAKAQEAIDFFVKLQTEEAGNLSAQMPELIQGAVEQAREQERETWGAALKTDLGEKYDETVAAARVTVQAFETPELIDAFNSTAVGNHPELVKLLAKVAPFLKDSKTDGIGRDASSAGEKKPLANRMYPDM